MKEDRDEQIFQLYLEGATLEEIAEKYYISRQRVHQVIKKMAKETGKEVMRTGSGTGISQYNVKLGGFFASPKQADAIQSVPGKSYSEKMRNIVQFYIENH